MPSLAELQVSMARALLAADPATRQLPSAWFAGDGERGLRTHRNNILGACCNALRQSYPTLEWLIGVEHFEALAADFVRRAPPTAPMLALYGEGFAAFAVERAAPEDRQLLDETARFDWLFERVAQSPAEDFSGPAAMLDGGAQLHLCSSLRLFAARYEVDSLRAGGTAKLLPADRHLALWRRAAGVAVQPLEPASAALLSALLAAAGLEVALAAASAAASAAGAADTLPALIEREVLRASFARLTTH
jgi:hypothetical protein